MKLVSIITPHSSHAGVHGYTLGIYDEDDIRIASVDDPRARFRCVDILGSYRLMADAEAVAARYLANPPAV